MSWLLLNQLFVSSVSEDLHVSVLEEVLSSEALLVQLLVSGGVSIETKRIVQSRETCQEPLGNQTLVLT